MKLIIFGASGRTGSPVLERSLSGDHGHHEVTAFVRDPSRIGFNHPRLRVIQGDAQSLESIASALQGQQIVVSTLGGQDLASNTQNLIEAMTNAGVKRLAVTLSIGLLLPSVEPRFAAISAQHRRILEALQAGELEWIAACPPGITDQPRTGQYLATPGRPPGNWTISRYDLADFLLQAALSEKFLRQAVGISN